MEFSRTKLSAAAAAVSVACAVLGAGTAAAAPAKPAPQTKCVVTPDNRDATVDALLNKCSSAQLLELFARAPLGAQPHGRKTLNLLPVSHLNQRLVPYDTAKALTQAQSKLGDSLTFGTGPQGRPWVYKNYLFGADLGGELKSGTSTYDGKPAWTADFRRDFAGVPVSVHEYRQLSPTVWIARDIIGTESRAAAKHSGGVMAIG